VEAAGLADWRWLTRRFSFGELLLAFLMTLVYTLIRLTSIQKYTDMKKKMGRPTDRVQDRQLQMRVDDEFLDEIDRWRLTEPDKPNRTQAIRRLVTFAIARLSQASPVAAKSRRPVKRNDEPR
jgi:hypothetical protein